MIFDPAQEGSRSDDLRGGARAPRRFIGWQTFFDFGGAYPADVRPNKLIDTKSRRRCSTCRCAIPGPETGVTALPQRNLLRHITWGLPSGQALRVIWGARARRGGSRGAERLRPRSVRLTPLWYYVLKEAEIVEAGCVWGRWAAASSARSSSACCSSTAGPSWRHRLAPDPSDPERTDHRGFSHDLIPRLRQGGPRRAEGSDPGSAKRRQADSIGVSSGPPFSSLSAGPEGGAQTTLALVPASPGHAVVLGAADFQVLDVPALADQIAQGRDAAATRCPGRTGRSSRRSGARSPGRASPGCRWRA